MCPICKSVQFVSKGLASTSPKASQVINKKYEVVQCLNCHTYYVEPSIILSLSDWQFLYDDEYFTPMSKWYYDNREKDRVERFDKLIHYSGKPKSNFLDVGCGEGYSLLEAEKRGWRAYGIDIADNRIIDAKKDSVKFKVGTLIETNFPDNYFDVIYMDSVLEHVVNPGNYLAEIRRILKIGGVVYLGVPNEDSLLNDIKEIYYRIRGKKFSSKLKPFESPYHIVGFNKDCLRTAVEQNGFRISELRNFACRTEFLKSKFLTKQFFHSLLLFPIYLFAVPLRKEVYLEVYAQK